MTWRRLLSHAIVAADEALDWVLAHPVRTSGFAVVMALAGVLVIEIAAAARHDAREAAQVASPVPHAIEAAAAPGNTCRIDADEHGVIRSVYGSCDIQEIRRVACGMVPCASRTDLVPMRNDIEVLKKQIAAMADAAERKHR